MTGHWLLLPDTRLDRAGFICPGIPPSTSPLGQETLTRHPRVAGVGTRRGEDRGVLHAPDCEKAPQGAPLLEVEPALDTAEDPGTRL